MEIGKSGVLIDYLGHSGFAVTANGSGRRIIIDPYQVSDTVEKADVVLITHCHPDSCSVKDIERVARDGATIVCTADVQSKILKMKGIDMHVVEVGDMLELGNVKIEVLAAYNKYTDHHPKSEGWVGYLLKMGDVIVYHAGDSDFVPEMQKLSGHGKHGKEFVALLPVSGRTVMGPEQAAEAASVMSPDLVIPMKFNAQTADKAHTFSELCRERNIPIEVLEKI